MLKHKRIASCVLVLALAFVLCIPAFASSFSADFSVRTGSSSSWSGKDTDLWKFTSTDEATFKTTLTYGTSVTSTLWMVKVWAPDQSITSYSVTKSDGSNSNTFVPQTSNSYYAVVQPADSYGVNGTVSAYN
ncbi:hypothetical protein B5E56_06195 [Flavonifractor sp. An112]|nr:hypothetical protein B5E56_06195 [Flavonifractor sp. An112]